jgi:hypothetical protein
VHLARTSTKGDWTISRISAGTLVATAGSGKGEAE